MTENKCKSLETLIPIATAKLLPTQLPVHFETYRHELHREMTNHWPVRLSTPEPSNIALATSKSTAYSSIRDGNKSNLTLDDNDTIHQTFSRSKSKNSPTGNSTRLHGKKAKIKNRLISLDSESALTEPQQLSEWNLKVQEGVISYRLPDGLPDGFALQKKLQKLLKTDTINLNDRGFWTKAENRFKKRRKENLQENMKHLRQTQRQYEQELLSKGVIPSTTEEVIKQYAEQHRTQMKMEKVEANNPKPKNCLIDYLPSKNLTDDLLNNTDELEAFESDNVHPSLQELFPDSPFQTKSSKAMSKKFENDLHQAQIKIKSIFPKTNQRDSIRQELSAIKTSEGLYAYSDRLIKRTSK